MSNSAFLLRPSPGGDNRMKEFLKDEIIAIGWSHLNNLEGKDIDELRNLMVSSIDYPDLKQGSKLGSALSVINNFVNNMKVGDFIVAPDGPIIYFGQIVSDYFFDSSHLNDDFAQQRRVKWLTSHTRDDLPDLLRRSLRVQRAIVNLTKHINTIKDLANNKNIEDCKELPDKTADLITTSYMLRPDFSIEISVPKNITETEAQRLGDFIKTLYWN